MNQDSIYIVAASLLRVMESNTDIGQRPKGSAIVTPAQSHASSRDFCATVIGNVYESPVMDRLAVEDIDSSSLAFAKLTGIIYIVRDYLASTVILTAKFRNYIKQFFWLVQRAHRDDQFARRCWPMCGRGSSGSKR